MYTKSEKGKYGIRNKREKERERVWKKKRIMKIIIIFLLNRIIKKCFVKNIL